jgi:hypothetical protein
MFTDGIVAAFRRCRTRFPVHTPVASRVVSCTFIFAIHTCQSITDARTTISIDFTRLSNITSFANRAASQSSTIQWCLSSVFVDYRIVAKHFRRGLLASEIIAVTKIGDTIIADLAHFCQCTRFTICTTTIKVCLQAVFDHVWARRTSVWSTDTRETVFAFRTRVAIRTFLTSATTTIYILFVTVFDAVAARTTNVGWTLTREAIRRSNTSFQIVTRFASTTAIAWTFVTIFYPIETTHTGSIVTIATGAIDVKLARGTVRAQVT